MCSFANEAKKKAEFLPKETETESRGRLLTVGDDKGELQHSLQLRVKKKKKSTHKIYEEAKEEFLPNSVETGTKQNQKNQHK